MITKEKSEYLDALSKYLRTVVTNSEWHTYTIHVKIMADGTFNYINECLVKGLPLKYPEHCSDVGNKVKE